MMAVVLGWGAPTGASGAVPMTSERNTNREPRCEILEYGPYVPLGARWHYDDPDAATGRSFEIDDVEFTTQTTIITKKRGDGFGIRYRAYNVPSRAKVTWRVVYPKPLRGFAEWRRDVRMVARDHVMHVVYDFDYAWEMVSGRWKFQVLVDGKAICRLAFTVR